MERPTNHEPDPGSRTLDSHGDLASPPAAEPGVVESPVQAGGGDNRRRLPVVPLRGMVPLPGLPLPIAVGRPLSLEAMRHAQEHGVGEVFLVTQRQAETEQPELEDLHGVGVIARTLKTLPAGHGTINAVMHADRRAIVHSLTWVDGHLEADVEVLPQPIYKENLALEAAVQTVRNLVHKMVALSSSGNRDFAMFSEQVDSPGLLADMVAATLPISAEEKQQVLATFDVFERLRLVVRLAGHTVEVLELSHKLEEEVHDQLEEARRQALLREQLRAVRKELGEDDDPELQRLKAMLEGADMNEEARATAERELARLESIGQGSPERGWITSHVEWLASLPWTHETALQADLEQAEEILDREHYGLGKAKERILETLAVKKLNPEGKASILCFVGPPGVGKTSLAQAVAEATGRELVRISVGGVSDESELRGHRRTYVGALPGRIITALKKAGSRNPVFVVDEVDKMAASYHGDPAAALLEVLDPEQNHTFVDRYIEIPFDLSKVLFITTANTLETLPRPLLDRMEVIEVASYTTEEKLAIARRHLIPRRIAETGLPADAADITDEAIVEIIEGYTREAGVRGLERQIDKVLRKLALASERGEEGPWTVTPAELPRFLGGRRFHHEAAERMTIPGIAMGLAWTPVGGELLFIEAAKSPGDGKLQLTGSLGEVMKESAAAALTWLRSHPDDYPDVDRHSYHVHVPAGATPKDGPSAGVTMLTALASAISGRRIRDDLAMTGEITLRGEVLPVGGIREKLLAAARAGIKTVLIPARNTVDLEEVPASAREALEIIPVQRAEEVLRHAFQGEGEDATNAA